MQNWDNMQAAATYEQHNNNNNNWYNSMLAQTEIKTEPDTESRMHEQQTVMTTTTNATMTTMKHKSSATSDVMSHLENYLRQQQQQQVQQQPQTPQQQQMSTVDALNAAMTPSPSNTDSMQQLVYDSGMQTQLLQQQQYQQQFQQAQQAAAHNQVTSTTPHLPLGFNPLTPPGLPTAIIPSITHFYHQQQQHHSASNNARHSGQQTPSPQPLHALAHTHAHMLQQPSTPMDSSEKLQSALTPRNTPPMDITPPKSPTKSQIAHLAEAMHMQQQQQQQEKQQQEQDAQSDTSDDMKYSTGDLDDEKMIREPIYNSHGKIKNYKCKSCGLIAITKVLFWEHARTHMKPEKILQCPKCPFVTELKHHLEYHIRKHKNLKPFQCDKCSYTCVNKSMLNSHRKSHSSVYQYRCADCDYATKYCHSFKLHLRKYDHKPGLVLDEEGLPNPSVVIDVYGTRRGPKSKGGAGANKRSNSHTSLDRLHAPKSMQQCQENGGTEFKLSASQLSAALQSFSMPTQQQQQHHQQQHQMPVSPAKSPSSLSSSSELQATRGLSQQQQQHQQKQQQMHALTHATQAKLQRQPSMQQNLKHLNPTQASTELTDTKSSMSSLLPPLATILQQNPNMAFFPYWNLNLQMLAAQQQAAALAQMPTNMREKALQELQNMHNNKETYLVRSPTQHAADNEVSDNDADEDDADDDDDQSDDRKSTDSAMDLSQGSPVKEDIEQQQRRTPAACIKLHDESNDTPIVSVNGAARRKGRVLKLDATLHVKSASAESLASEEELMKVGSQAKCAHEHVSPTQASSPIPNRAAQLREQEEEEEEVVVGSSNACAPPIAMDMDSAEVVVNEQLTKTVSAACTSSTSTNSTASSSGNSSNGSSSTASQTSTTANGPPALGTMYECKYCDIYFKDAVLYTIHMGYHSCDDVFKCNMCGEKCDGPVGLFVHMARNAHS